MKQRKIMGRRGRGGGRYWFIPCYYTRQDAEETFSGFAKAGFPTLLFAHNYIDMWCVAVYANGKQLLGVGWRPSAESFIGLLRVRELLVHGTLVKAANFGTQMIDEVIDKILSMKDELGL